MKKFYLLIFLCLGFSMVAVRAQNVFNINDKDSVFTANPPPTPAYGPIVKWGHANRLNWGGTGTTTFKSYYYKGMQFRLKFPHTYQQGVSDGKVYPIYIFIHGLGEAGNIYDNEYQMFHGGNVFRDAVDNGTFDGFLFYHQSTTGWSDGYFPMITNMIDSLVKYCKVDRYRIIINGLSSGGQGCWDLLGSYPQYPCIAPIISAARPEYIPNIPQYIHIPIWLFNGGQDNNPAPAEATQLIDSIRNRGGYIQQTFYPTLGHGVWDNAWADPGFFPFILSGYQSNPLVYFQKTNFCPGNTISAKLGVTQGFFAYQWMKDGVVIPGATANEITVSQLGTYSARIQTSSGSRWSDWSHTPAVLTSGSVANTPPIQIVGLKSIVLPAPDSSKTVPLAEPVGYAGYQWIRTSDNAVMSTQDTFYAPPGTYVAQITALNACTSTPSAAFTVENANGANGPDPASNLTVTPASQTSLRLDWSKNPHPSISETGFEIYRASSSSGAYTLIGINAKDSLTYYDKGLVPNTAYFYTVRAINNSAASKSTNQASAKTLLDTIPPTTPANLTVTGTSQNSVSLQWTASTDIAGVTYYDIYVNGKKAYTTAATNTSYTVFNLTHKQTYAFQVLARDAVGNSSPLSNQVTATAAISGLQYSYYNGVWNNVPDFTTIAPLFTGTATNVSLSTTIQTTDFGYFWQGYINIPKTGSYTFETNSDDGSMLWIDTYKFSTPLVNNDGLHGSQSVSKAVTLTAGIHPIYMAFFQQGGGYNMNVYWTSTAAGIARSAIPDSAFTETVSLGGVPPAAATSLTATAQSYSKIGLNWTYVNNASPATGFTLFRSTGGAPLAAIGTVGAGALSFVDSTVSPNTLYNYSIQANGQYGQSSFFPQQGTNFAVYNLGSTLNQLPNFNTLTPVATGLWPNFSLGMTSLTVNFGVKFDSYITIVQPGVYTFSTASDDGSALYIGGYNAANLVVNNDGLHGTVTAIGTINLQPGIYPITVVYYQGGGGFNVSASYSGPGVANQVIPTSVLSAGFASATSLQLPPAPAAPKWLKATSVSSSSIKIAWKDSTNDAASFQIFRSSGTNASYRQIASVVNTGGVSFAYSDSSLFDNVMYFYEVNAVNVGGTSAFSNYDSAATAVNNPVIAPIKSFTMRYGSIDTVTLNATDADAVSLALSSLNTPSFATFKDNGNGTGLLILAPAAKDTAVYNNIILVATAANGGVGRDTFNLVVNNNYPPVLSPISAASFTEATTDTVNLSATDPDGVSGLVWSSSNLPSFGSIVDKHNGTAYLVLKPTFIAHGTYAIQLTVTDPMGASSTQTLNLTILKGNPNQKILVRVKYQQTLPLPWNNMTSSFIGSMLATDGTPTTVSLSLSSPTWWQPFNEGLTTGNNSGVYPDAVLQECYWFGIYGGPDVIYDTISGLRPNSNYSFKFYAGSNYGGLNDNGSTVFATGSASATLRVQSNTSNTANLNNIQSDATGTVIVSMSKSSGSVIGYFNALEINHQFDDSTAPAKPTNLGATLLQNGSVQLNWSDPAYNAYQYFVYRATDTTQPFTLLDPTANDPNMVSFLDSTVIGHTTYYYKLKAVNNYGDQGFTGTVGITTAAKAPTMSAIRDTVAKSNTTVTIGFTATDDPGDAVTVSSNLPVFANLQNLGNGSYSITLTPAKKDLGVYLATVTATDSYGKSVTSQFHIFVTESNISSVYLNFGTSADTVSQPWNNFTTYPFAGAAMSNLLRADGTNSGMTVTLVDAWSNPPVDFGMITGNNNGVFPDVVLRGSLFESTTSQRRITMSGLDGTKRYNVVVFSSVNNGMKATTTFSVNGQSQDYDAAYNTNKTIQFNGLIPDGSGTITLTFTKDAPSKYGYLSAMIIQSYDPSVVPIAGPNFVFAEPLFNSRTSLKLTWADRSSNETGFEIWRSTSAAGTFSLVTTVPANTTTYTNTGLVSNTQYFYQIRAVNATQQSDYSQVISATTPSSIVLIHTTWHYPEAIKPWNNTAINPQVGDRYANLQDDQLNNTGMALNVLSTFGGELDNGMTSNGSNLYIFPDSVMYSNFWVQNGSMTAILKLDGLDQSKKYRIGFEGSSIWTLDMTGAMTINGVTKYLNADSNTNKVVYFDSVSTNQNGEILLTFNAKGQYGVLGALVVMAYTDNGTIPESGTISSGGPERSNDSSGVAATLAPLAHVADTNQVIQLKDIKAYPNPFRDAFTISFSNESDIGKKVSFEVFNASGMMVLQQEGGYAQAGLNVYDLRVPQGTPTGLYYARVMFNGRIVKTFKVVKLR